MVDVYCSCCNNGLSGGQAWAPDLQSRVFLLVRMALVPLGGFGLAEGLEGGRTPGAEGLRAKEPGLRLRDSQAPTPIRWLCQGGIP